MENTIHTLLYKRKITVKEQQKSRTRTFSETGVAAGGEGGRGGGGGDKGDEKEMTKDDAKNKRRKDMKIRRKEKKGEEKE